MRAVKDEGYLTLAMVCALAAIVLSAMPAHCGDTARSVMDRPVASREVKRKLVAHPLMSTSTCGSTTIAINSEEPTCNSHNGRWIGITETSSGNVYWTPTPMAHPTFNYAEGIVGLPDQGTYLITTEVPVASDCGIPVTVYLKINGTVVEGQVSPGGNRILRHRFVYVKQDLESVTDEVNVHISSTSGSYAQGAVLDIQRLDIAQ